MFNANESQTLMLRPRQQQQQQQQQQPLHQQPPQPQRSPESQLPRGECRFIIPELDTEGNRQRCTCVSYCLNKGVPGLLCGCGHQAWHHVTEPTGAFVPVADHLALIDQFKKLEEHTRKLQDEVVRERKDRDRHLRELQSVQFNALGQLRYYVDDRIEKLRLHAEDKMEGLEDKATELADIRRQVSDLDEIVMRLEDRIDSGKRASRSMTPLLEGQKSPSTPLLPERVTAELPFRSVAQSEAWDVRVILVPSKHIAFAFSIDSLPYQRCQTRGLHQDIRLRNHSSETFVASVENVFMGILRRRPWMPLQCLKSSDMSLCQLRSRAFDPTSWDYEFLESQCMAHDKLQGEIIFIALQHEELSWEEIRSLPSIFGADESCWEYHEELDSSKAKDSIAAEDRMETERSRPADTESIISEFPPPYTSRASMYSPDTPRQGPLRQSPLDVLAGAAAGSTGLAAPSISERSTYSAPSIISERSVTSMGSIDSTLALSEADEHRTKRTKRGMFMVRSPSQPHLGSPPGTSIHSAPSSPPQGQIYYSGRAKRKIQPTQKVREPMDWRPSEFSLKNILHRNDSKEKRPSTSGTGSINQSEMSS
ncbi:hypothetical protein BT63DRAFT_284642 [Microthyrium microscopicum]|uniref:Uncharacterized protein n=1 Tax=Microthyrium microscopicum TaxID=703497 RepID=A0A6A6UAW7_9PEZI|nr:hypothetical protein BT63DRAFT_284642 [Microthyrium microscopicum]